MKPEHGPCRSLPKPQPDETGEGPALKRCPLDSAPTPARGPRTSLSNPGFSSPGAGQAGHATTQSSGGNSITAGTMCVCPTFHRTLELREMTELPGSNSSFPP